MTACPNCDAALVGRRTCPACDPAPVGLIRKALSAIGVAGWLVAVNVRDRLPQRRAEDGRSWWHTVVVCIVWAAIVGVACLLFRCAEMQVSELRANTAALDKAICERDALVSGEPAEGCAR